MFINPIFYYVPNLVGYARIAFTTLAFVYVFDRPMHAAFFYLLGAGLDAVDGVCARYFDQCSRLGAMLDMLTDRMSTAVLLMALSRVYPMYWGTFTSLVVLDIVSHWFFMYTKLALNKMTHKGSTNNPLLKFYYTFPYALLTFCVGNEFCFVAMYLASFPAEHTPLVPQSVLSAVLFVTFPLCVMKQVINVVHLYDSVLDAVELDTAAVKRQ